VKRASDPGVAALTRRQLLISAALASGSAAASAACSSAGIVAVTRPDPAYFDACRAQRQIKVLTWNVFMMPSWVGESPNNEPRAAAIATTLLEHDFDILCLQKVFDSSARAVLEAVLAERYPYRYGPANDGCSLNLNSGVWVLSRFPLTDYQEIQFKECDSWECFSRKGALLLSGTCGSTPFRLVATHLQGEESSSFTPKNQAIRDQQLLEIRDHLITPHLEPMVPFIICGDFGTPRLMASCYRETIEYSRMLATLGVQNGPQVRITLDESPQGNQLAKSDSGRRNELDYIFLRSNGFPVTAERSRQIFRRHGWDPKYHRSDLSYRYAVSATLTFGAG